MNARTAVAAVAAGGVLVWVSALGGGVLAWAVYGLIGDLAEAALAAVDLGWDVVKMILPGLSA